MKQLPVMLLCIIIKQYRPNEKQVIHVAENSSLIEQLNSELHTVDDFTPEDVFNAFEKYITNKAKLQKVVNFGLLHYDYTKYKTLFEGTLFEEGLAQILHLYDCALSQNYPKSIQIFEDSYPDVARGFASRTQVILTSGINPLPDRLDLFTKTAFQLIGDGIENSLKPFLGFLEAVYCVSQNKSLNKKKLGVIVDVLISNNELFKSLYKNLFLDITISQWRNIADHGSYSCTSDGKIEIHYGEKNKVTKYIERQDLEMVLVTLDTLLYMHKTAYTLIHIDHIDNLPTTEKYHETTNDDLVMQIVETSYAYGFEAFSIEKENWDIAVLLRKYDLTRQDIEQYCAVIAAILTEKKFSVLIYNGTQVQYQIIYDQRRAEIYRYIVRNESHSVDEKGWRKKKRILLLLQTLWNAIRKK